MEIDTLVRGEQVRTLYRQGAGLLANLINGLVLCAIVWNSAPLPLITTWTIVMALLTIWRLSMRRRYFRANPGPEQVKAWAARFVLGSTATGVLWGLGGYWFFDSNQMSQLLMPFALGGMCAGAAGTNACYLPAFFCYASPALFGIIVRALVLGDPLHLAMAAMLSVYAVAFYFVATVNHRSLREAFRLRFENDALLLELSSARAHLEDTNRTLEDRVAVRTQALQRQTEALRKSQRLEAVGRLAGGVAHDFNNLLTVALLNVEEILEAEAAEFARSRLVEVRDAAARGAALVKQLLLFSRQQSLKPEIIELNGRLIALQPIVARLVAGGAKVNLQWQLETEPLFVCVEPAQIDHVIVNLVSNARDAMPAGGAITMRTERTVLQNEEFGLTPGAYAVLRVTDTGQGMDSETRTHIFEPFFTTKEVGKGTGLGLATVYGIVEQSGGALSVLSQLEEGSEFRVYLPLQQAGAKEEPRVPSARHLAPRSATVLLVEDDAAVRAVTQRILQSAGYRVLIAENAERALSLVDEHLSSVSLLVSDVVMPGLDGPALAQRLRERRPELRVLFISGYSRRNIAYSELPNTDFLAKPFTHGALLEKAMVLLAAI